MHRGAYGVAQDRPKSFLLCGTPENETPYTASWALCLPDRLHRLAGAPKPRGSVFRRATW